MNDLADKFRQAFTVRKVLPIVCVAALVVVASALAITRQPFKNTTNADLCYAGQNYVLHVYDIDAGDQFFNQIALHPERLEVLSAFLFYGMVSNGGFGTTAMVSYGMLALHAADAYEKYGIPEASEIVRRQVGLWYPGGSIPSTREELEELVDLQLESPEYHAWWNRADEQTDRDTDRFFELLDDDSIVWQNMAEMIRKNHKLFPRSEIRKQLDWIQGD